MILLQALVRACARKWAVARSSAGMKRLRGLRRSRGSRVSVRATRSGVPRSLQPQAGTGSSRRRDSQPESTWRERANQHRRAVSQAEQRIGELEAKLAEIRNDLAPTNVMDPNREQTRRAEYAQTQAELEVAKGELERARQALADLEEEARRKGVPPGWIREN